MMLMELFRTFLRIGAFTFGGGYAMLPLIQAEVVAREWIQSKDVVNFIAVSESTPGPFAVNISTFVGAQMAGFSGALLATLGVVLPSFVIILVVARYFEKFRSSRFVSGCMEGLKPAVIGLIASALVSIGRTVLFPEGFSFDLQGGYALITSLMIFAGILFLIFRKIHPIYAVLISAVLGIGTGYLGELLIG
ncbi:MAG: chromate transporter [Christensenellales bacterium]|nr:chromate transporter [Christensenellales bacterium]